MFLSDSDAKMVAQEVARLLRPMLNGGSNGDGKPPSKAPSVPKRLMTVEETARYLGRTKSAVEHLIHRRGLPGCIVRLDGRVYVDRIALDKLIEGGKV